jgi:hypothetical protein
MKNGYEINLDWLCKNQRFKPEEVVDSRLVFPAGAVPNSQLIWLRVELQNTEVRFITLALRDFHQYVILPSTTVGGWTEGEKGHDRANLEHLEKYNIGDTGSDSAGHDSGDEVDDLRSSGAI